MELSKAIEGIQKHRARIHSEDMWSDAEQLSDAMTKLATYNAYLAENIAPLHKRATDTAYGVFTAAKADGETISASEQMSRGESTSERMEFENVSNIYKATKDLISVLQTRLGVIRDQMKQEGVQV